MPVPTTAGELRDFVTSIVDSYGDIRTEGFGISTFTDLASLTKTLISIIDDWKETPNHMKKEIVISNVLYYYQKMGVLKEYDWDEKVIRAIIGGAVDIICTMRQKDD